MQKETFMSKYQAISIAIALVSLGSYVVMREQEVTSLITEHSILATDTAPITSSVLSLTSTTSTPPIIFSPEMVRLLNLVNDCQVESISFPPTHGEPAKSVKSIILKDGNLFENPNLITESDIPILGVAIRDVRDKCRIKVGITIID
jgi:hypothetical protein